jgi:hypothetical protein
MSVNDDLSFIATMNIRGYPVTLVRKRLATQWDKAGPMRFYFKYSEGFYTMQVMDGEYKGWQVNTTNNGFLEASDGANSFKLLTTSKATVSLENIKGDHQTVYLQTRAGYFVQQNMEGLTAFDDDEVMYNFLLAVPRVDRGDGKYMAMEEDVWVVRPVGYPDRTNPAFINIHIEQKGVH